MSANDSGWQPGFPGMTDVASVEAPGDFVVVAGAAEFAIDDVVHRDVVQSGPHLETEFVMANATLKADAVEPVRKDHRAHTFLLGTPVDNDVSIFRVRRSDRKK
jgi:hypothetical protein